MGDRLQLPPPLYLGLSENVVLVGKFSSKMQNLGLKNLHFGEIEIFSRRNIFYRKFAAVSLKIATSCAAKLFHPPRRWRLMLSLD